MAIITTTMYCSDPGVIWAQCVSLWSGWMPSTTDTFSHVNDIVEGYNAIVTTRVQPVNTIVTQLLDISQTSGSRYRPDVLCSFPGWNTSPVRLDATLGGKDTRTEWESKLVSIRKTIWINFTNAFTPPFSFQSEALDWFGANSYLAYTPYKQKGIQGVDWTPLTTTVPATGKQIPGNANVAQGNKQANIPVGYGSEGGSVDTTAIVEALNDIALRDVDYTANNGSAIFSMRGRVNT